MVKIIFEYEIPAEDRDEYLRETSEKVKPFWESKGCKGYYVWQEAEKENRFVKEMLFDDAASLKEIMNLEEAEPYKSIFRQFAKDISRRIIVQRI
jgi:quinol monooxygenase YgiN